MNRVVVGMFHLILYTLIAFAGIHSWTALRSVVGTQLRLLQEVRTEATNCSPANAADVVLAQFVEGAPRERPACPERTADNQ